MSTTNPWLKKILNLYVSSSPENETTRSQTNLRHKENKCYRHLTHEMNRIYLQTNPCNKCLWIKNCRHNFIHFSSLLFTHRQCPFGRVQYRPIGLVCCHLFYIALAIPIGHLYSTLRRWEYCDTFCLELEIIFIIWIWLDPFFILFYLSSFLFIFMFSFYTYFQH